MPTKIITHGTANALLVEYLKQIENQIETKLTTLSSH